MQSAPINGPIFTIATSSSKREIFKSMKKWFKLNFNFQYLVQLIFPKNKKNWMADESFPNKLPSKYFFVIQGDQIRGGTRLGSDSNARPKFRPAVIQPKARV